MLPLQFFGQNLHFAIYLVAALVFFAVFWLYFDAWISGKTKSKKEALKWLGFLLASVSFLVQSTVVEQSILGKSIFGDTTLQIAIWLRLAGYLAIIVGELLNPIQKRPQTKSLDEQLAKDSHVETSPPRTINVQAVAPAGTTAYGGIYGLPVGALAIAILYWRRATTGLERHLKPVAIAFLVLFGFELTALASLAQSTSNPTLFNIVKPFGALWITSHILLAIAAITLGIWVWRYLTERFISQLFMVFTATIIVIFLLTTVSFTFLLMRNVKDEALDNLQTATSVLSYALDAKKAETQANAEVLSQNAQVASAIAAHDHKSLNSLTSNFLASKKESTLLITNSSAQVLLRGEDPDKWGDSLSSNNQVRKALVGTSSSTVVTKQGVLAPVVYIQSTVPVRDSSGNIVGTVSVGLAADNGFMDGIKNSTGLDSAIYSGNVLSATTFLAADGKTRQVGVKQADKTIDSTVLTHGQTYKGTLNVLNRPLLAVYAPLKDADNNVVGMLFVAKPQSSLLKTAGRSIELTFVVAAVLIVLSIIPAYLMARYLSRQLE